jgi:hypothetical protein
MSGGGSKKPADTKPTTTTQPMQTVPPGMPGQIDTLSQQLAAGFGQPQGDILAYLNQYYQPMSLPNYAPVAPTPTPTPATPVTAPKTTPRTNQNQNILARGFPEYDPKTGAYNPLHSGGANR